MAGFTRFFFACTAFFALSVSLSTEDVFSTVPPTEPLYVIDGQNGPTLECGLKSEFRDRKTFEVSWTRYSHGQIRHISRDSKLLDKEHYELIEDSSSGKYFLKIKQVARTITEGSFQCSILNQDTGDQFAAEPNKVVILIAPGAPEIVSAPSVPLVEGEGVSLKCRSEGGSPSPNMQWLFDNRTVAEPELYSVINKEDIVESTIHWRARPEDNGAFLTCLVTNKALEGQSPKTVQSPRLNVLYKPTVTAGPVQDYAVEEGETIELVCNGEGNPSPSGFEWKHLVSGERYLAAKWPFVAERRFAGDFECRARNSIGESSDKLTLNVQYKPVVTTKEMVNPSEGDTVSLECSIDANPREENVQWTGPNGFTARGTKLVLPNISREQSGNYTCSATNYLNLYGQSGSLPRIGHSTVVVDVRRKPGQARISPPSFSVPVGGTIQLTCSAVDPGSPVASYKWSSPSSGGQFGTPEHNREVLVIRNAQLADNGEYKCLPYNQIGEGEVGSQTVTVIEPATIARPLTTERIYNSGEQASGLECEAQGYPAPTISWYRDGQAVDKLRFSVEAENGRSSCSASDFCSQTVTSTLSFKNPVDWSDKGNYSCVASNGGSDTVSTWSLVRVVHGPQILNEQYNGESLAATEIGTTARISCRVSARPEPSFVWLRDSLEVEDGDRYSIATNKLSGKPDEYESVLSFGDASKTDYGQYMCRSTNGKGEKAEVIIRLKEKSLPQNADLLQSLSTSPTSLFIAWKPGFDGGYSQTFVVEYRRLNPFSETVADEEVTTVEVKNLQRVEVRNKDANRSKRSPRMISLVGYNLTNLAPLSTYYFRVRAKNEMGMSDFTPVVISTTNDVYEDVSIEAPVSLIYNPVVSGLSILPAATADVCVQLYVAHDDNFRGAGCWAPDREIKELAGGRQFRTRFCSRARTLTCSQLSPIAVAPSPLSSQWRLIVPVIVLLLAVLLIVSILLVCCRSRRLSSEEKKKKRAVVEIRPEVSGPLPPADAKNTIVHGSATDSGVFTLENGKGQESYNTQTFSANETVPERDSWPAAPNGENFDPFHNDPYLNEYDTNAWQHGTDFGDGSGSAENATATTHDDVDSDSDAYSGGGRVMREIIV